MNIFTLELTYNYEGATIHTVVTSYDEAIEAKDTVMESGMSFDRVIIRQWTDGAEVWDESYYR